MNFKQWIKEHHPQVQPNTHDWYLAEAIYQAAMDKQRESDAALIDCDHETGLGATVTRKSAALAIRNNTGD